MVLKFAKLKEGAVVPSKRPGDLGYDIYSCFTDEEFEIPAHTTKMIPTGIASIIPQDWGVILEERGSTGSIGLKRSAGIIDSNYRGEWFVALTNTNNLPIIITNKVEKTTNTDDAILYPYAKAIAQAIVVFNPDPRVEEITVEELQAAATERGAGKLGSSGK